MSPTVTVVIITYNQQEYVSKAIDSVLMQKVNFLYEIVIGEDCGSDNTRSICEEYAKRYDIIKLLPRTKNLGVAGNWCECISASSGKYIMMLDGDDYWTAPNKMQLQVDFMEQHPECFICHTDNNILYMNTGNFGHSHKKNVPEGMILQDVMAGREQITSSTMCLRAAAVHKYIPFNVYVLESFPCEDWPTIAILSAYGEIRYLPNVTTVYRVGQTSITNERDYNKIRLYWKRSKHMTECIYEILPELGEFKDSEWFDTYVNNVLLNAAYENNDYNAAQKFAKLNPLNNRIATRCAKNWILFKLYRLYHLCKK